MPIVNIVMNPRDDSHKSSANTTVSIMHSSVGVQKKIQFAMHCTISNVFTQPVHSQRRESWQ